MTYAPYYGYVENPILDQIELSVRAGRVLRDSGLVQTLDDFMALTEAKVRPLKGAGAKTWREIKEIQESIGRDPMLKPKEDLTALRDFVEDDLTEYERDKWACDACARANDEDAAAMQEMAEDDRAHAQMERNAGL